MKFFRSFLIALSLVLAPLVAQAQTATQQSPTRLDACSGFSTASGTAQQTVTLTPPAGQFVYICFIEVIATATTAPALTAITHTTTNLNGVKLFDVFPAATGVVKTLMYPGMAPLKSATPGTAVTVVSNAAVTSITYNVNVAYYFSP